MDADFSFLIHSTYNPPEPIASCASDPPKPPFTTYVLAVAYYAVTESQLSETLATPSNHAHAMAITGYGLSYLPMECTWSSMGSKGVTFSAEPVKEEQRRRRRAFL